MMLRGFAAIFSASLKNPRNPGSCVEGHCNVFFVNNTGQCKQENSNFRKTQPGYTAIISKPGGGQIWNKLSGKVLTKTLALDLSECHSDIIIEKRLERDDGGFFRFSGNNPQVPRSLRFINIILRHMGKYNEKWLTTFGLLL